MSQARKSTVEEIRQRFDGDVERFANLDSGQAATMDAPLVMELVTAAAARVTPQARSVLDVGCGAGNYTLKLLEKRPGLDVTLLDLSRPMLDRAVERLGRAGAGSVNAVQGDVRDVPLPDGAFDNVLAAACLHHLRGEDEWRAVFAKVFGTLRAGGSFWVADLVSHDDPRVQAMMWERYGDYLAAQGGPAYRDKVFAYVEKEDTPRSLPFQLDLLRAVGFRSVEVLHKNACFAAFGGLRAGAGSHEGGTDDVR